MRIDELLGIGTESWTFNDMRRECRSKLCVMPRTLIMSFPIEVVLHWVADFTTIGHVLWTVVVSSEDGTEIGKGCALAETSRFRHAINVTTVAVNGFGVIAPESTLFLKVCRDGPDSRDTMLGNAVVRLVELRDFDPSEYARP